MFTNLSYLQALIVMETRDSCLPPHSILHHDLQARHHTFLIRQHHQDLKFKKFLFGLVHTPSVWKSWRKFPKNTRNLIFSEFGKYFEWDPTQTSQIRSIFYTCATNSIKHRMYHIQQTKKKPEWLGQAVFDQLNQIFLHDFRKESERNKQNRASDCDGQGFSLHVGGCVSHSEHIDKMAAKQGRTPTIAEAFMHLHSKVDSEGNVKKNSQRSLVRHRVNHQMAMTSYLTKNKLRSSLTSLGGQGKV